MLAAARVDYSRFREIRVDLLADDRDDRPRPDVRRGRARLGVGSSSPTRFQPSELAKLLLIVALAAFVIERTRRGTPIGQTLRILALGLAPAALVFLQPDLGTGIVLMVITLTILFLAGVPGRTSRRSEVWRRSPSASSWSSPRLPACRARCTAISRPADCIPASQQRPERCELSGQPERHRDWLR